MYMNFYSCIIHVHVHLLENMSNILHMYMHLYSCKINVNLLENMYEVVKVRECISNFAQIKLVKVIKSNLTKKSLKLKIN